MSTSATHRSLPSPSFAHNHLYLHFQTPGLHLNPSFVCAHPPPPAPQLLSAPTSLPPSPLRTRMLSPPSAYPCSHLQQPIHALTSSSTSARACSHLRQHLGARVLTSISTSVLQGSARSLRSAGEHSTATKCAQMKASVEVRSSAARSATPVAQVRPLGMAACMEGVRACTCRMILCVHACVRVQACVWVRECMPVSVCACVCVCACLSAFLHAGGYH